MKISYNMLYLFIKCSGEVKYRRNSYCVDDYSGQILRISGRLLSSVTNNRTRYRELESAYALHFNITEVSRNTNPELYWIVENMYCTAICCVNLHGFIVDNRSDARLISLCIGDERYTILFDDEVMHFRSEDGNIRKCVNTMGYYLSVICDSPVLTATMWRRLRDYITLKCNNYKVINRFGTTDNSSFSCFDDTDIREVFRLHTVPYSEVTDKEDFGLWSRGAVPTSSAWVDFAYLCYKSLIAHRCKEV